MKIPLLQVDAFTDSAYSGNPAGVVLLSEFPADEWMRAVAREMALSETAFLVPLGPETFALRWFTPAAEIDLCGHATLASGHALWERGVVAPGRRIDFETKSGRLSAQPLAGGWVELDFPRWHFEEPHDAAAIKACAELESGLGAPVVAASRGGRNWLFELGSEAAVRSLVPDLGVLAERGDLVIVTAAAEDPAFDCVCRVFVPALGIPEDPVTGSAHCILGPYWATRLGRDRVVSRQASARGGVVRVEVRGERVGIAGRAVTVFEATMTEAAAEPLSTATIAG